MIQCGLKCFGVARRVKTGNIFRDLIPLSLVIKIFEMYMHSQNRVYELKTNNLLTVSHLAQ